MSQKTELKNFNKSKFTIFFFKNLILLKLIHKAPYSL